MNTDRGYLAPWHAVSFDLFASQSLPSLLSRKLTLSGYQASRSPGGGLSVLLQVSGATGDVEARFRDLPAPDDEGVFRVGEERLVVLPMAENEDLSSVAVLCVGEQLERFVSSRMGQPPQGLTWDAHALESWFPLDAWFREFLAQHGQPLDEQNWLARHVHLRRVAIPTRRQPGHPGQRGRVCPYEAPSGPNIGAIVTVARGAEIRDGRLVVTDARPAMGLGLSAACVPFVNSSDGARVLAGVNMMRQWCTPLEPEPALVRTGEEPDEPELWSGTNLLTVFMCMGVETYRDALLISESAATKLRDSREVEPGDKLSNRHGTQGVVSRIVPDALMPRLPDGTLAEIVVPAVGQHTRMNLGQLLEAAAGRVARVSGRPYHAPPFDPLASATLRQALEAAGLDPSGMERVRMPEGTHTELPVCLGWVYWGRTHHLASSKLRSWTIGAICQRQGEMEQEVLRGVGAYENVLENLNTRSAERADAGTLAQRVAAGEVLQADAPTPLFTELQRRLRVAGIEMTLESDRLGFSWGRPADGDLPLALPVDHPWLQSVRLSHVGRWDESATYRKLCEANERLSAILAHSAPRILVDGAHQRVQALVRELLGELDLKWHLLLGARVLFSGRGVIAPGTELAMDQVGLPEEMAWSLFGPMVEREAGGGKGLAALAKVMEASIVMVNRAPTLSATAMVALRPVRVDGKAIRIHPLMCRWMNADFDGDQVAVMVPLTSGAQREARELLSPLGHLSRDPGLLESLLPDEEMLWGLAWLCLREAGKQTVSACLGARVPDSAMLDADLLWRMVSRAARGGADSATLDRLSELGRLGFEASKSAGLSMSPFWGEDLALPSRQEELADALSSFTDFGSVASGLQILAVKSGARGSMDQLARLVTRGFARGLSYDECVDNAEEARRRLYDIIAEEQAADHLRRIGYLAAGYGVLARARRAALGRPGDPGEAGVAFARAAVARETDPLTDEESRLFVGLRPLVS